jgi:hypothetical protein
MNLKLEVLACWFAATFGLICSIFSYRSGEMLFSKLFAIVCVGAIIEIVYIFYKFGRDK